MSSFRRNTLFASVGNFSTTAALASVIVATARLGTPEVVGRFSFALAACAPVFVLASLRLRDISATEADENYSVKVFFLISLVTNAAALISIVPLSLAIGLEAGTIYVALLLGLWKTVTALSDIVYGYHQRNTTMDLIAKLQLFHCAGTVVTFVVTFYLTRSLLVAIALLASVNLMIFLLCDLPSVLKSPKLNVGQPNQRVAELAIKIAWQTLPLGIAGAVFALNMLIPRWLLEKFFSLEIVGVFSVLAFFARLGTPVMQAMGQTASRGLADAVREKNAQKFLRLLKRKALFPLSTGFVFVILSWLMGPVVLKLIYGPEYVVSAVSTALVMVYATLVYAATFLSFGLIAARRHRSQMAVLIATIFTGFVFGWFLVPSYGIEGACLSLVLSSIVRMVGTGLTMYAIVCTFQNVETCSNNELNGVHRCAIGRK